RRDCPAMRFNISRDQAWSRNFREQVCSRLKKTSDRKRYFLLQRIVARGPRFGGGAGLADGADPVEIAAAPDIRKTDQQHSEERKDIDNRHPRKLPSALADHALSASHAIRRCHNS